METSIYSGPHSCYARYEGMYVAGGAMDLRKAAAHIYLHLRDLSRGWTYDHTCRKIRMTHGLFTRRTLYLAELCRKMGGNDCQLVEALANFVVETGMLPDCLMRLASSKLVKVQSLI